MKACALTAHWGWTGMAGKGGDPTMAAAESQQIQPIALYDLLLCCVISQVH